MPVPDVKPLRTMLDPGHGGWDSGALGKGGAVREANVNLVVALKAAQILERAGHQVELTRTTDIGLAPAGFTGEKRRIADLMARPALARRFGAQLFVSIHSNAASDERARGIETFHYRYPVLAGNMQRHLVAFTGAHDRGVKFPPPTSDPNDDPAALTHWPVLHDPACPAVLVECGFVSNLGELALLCEPAYQVRLACAIAAGIMAYRGEVAK